MVIHKTIKGVIFDFDGTLFDLAVDWQSLNKTLADEFGVDSLATTGSFPTDVKQEIIELIGEFEAEGVERGVPLPGASDVLLSLAGKYGIAITSRNNRATIQKGLEKIGFNGRHEVVAREDVIVPKPDPEALQQTLQKMDLSPKEVLVVGDTTHDLEAAKALGIICVIVSNHKLVFQPKGADYYIDSLTGLLNIVETINSRG